VPANILLLDFLKLDREIARLEAQEEALEAQIEKDRDAADAAQATILASIVKAQRVVSASQERS
jgi:cell division protein FtsB